MKTKQASIIGLLTLILIAGSAITDDARAGIKVRATLTTPQVRVHYSNAPAKHYRRVVREHRTYRERNRHPLTRHDYRVAKRLSHYTGIPRRELIDLRRYGYTWREIGRWYDLPRPLMQAATDHRSSRRWQRFERDHGRRGREVCRYDRKYDRYDD